MAGRWAVAVVALVAASCAAPGGTAPSPAAPTPVGPARTLPSVAAATGAPATAGAAIPPPAAPPAATPPILFFSPPPGGFPPGFSPPPGFFPPGFSPPPGFFGPQPVTSAQASFQPQGPAPSSATLAPAPSSGSTPSPSPVRASSAPAAAATPYQLPPEYQATFAEPGWERSPSLPSGFMIGATLQDYYSTYMYTPYMRSTVAAMQRFGANWFVYDNYNTYTSIEPPRIGPFPPQLTHETTQMREATDAEIGAMAKAAHDRGMKFALVSELNWDGMLAGCFGICQENLERQAQAERRLEQLAEGIDAPTPASTAYWDSWFEAYGAFAMRQAAVAEANAIEMLVIGKQLGSVMREGNLPRWKALVRRVRSVYRGSVSYAAWTGDSVGEMFPWEDADQIVIYHNTKISDAERTTVAELKRTMDAQATSMFAPLAARYGKRIVFLTIFQSRDHGAQNVWFESGMRTPDIREDLLIQAQLYEAFFQSIASRPWAAGVWTWGFWWRDDFDTQFFAGDVSFGKSSSVRNKPAGEIIRKWSAGIR